MKFKQIESKRTFVLRLERGEEVIEKLTQFCKENKIEGGTIQGIGALSYAKLYAIINPDKFETKESEFVGAMELVSCLGNITINKGNQNPIIHLHVCLELNAKSEEAGHLLKGIISFTGEFFIQETEKIEKKKDGGLLLMDL